MELLHIMYKVPYHTKLYQYSILCHTIKCHITPIIYYILSYYLIWHFILNYFTLNHIAILYYIKLHHLIPNLAQIYYVPYFMLLYHTIHIKINYFMIYQPNIYIPYNIISHHIIYHITYELFYYNVHYVQNILLKYTTIHAIYYRYILSSQSNIISIFLFSPFSTVKISSNERVPPRVPHSTLSTRVAILSTGTRARKLSRKDSRLQATILVLLPPKPRGEQMHRTR